MGYKPASVILLSASFALGTASAQGDALASSVGRVVALGPALLVDAKGLGEPAGSRADMGLSELPDLDGESFMLSGTERLQLREQIRKAASDIYADRANGTSVLPQSP